MQSTHSNVTITGILQRSRLGACRVSLDTSGTRPDLGRGRSCVQLGITRDETVACHAMATSYGERTAWIADTDTVTDQAQALEFGPLYHSQRWRFAT